MSRESETAIVPASTVVSKDVASKNAVPKFESILSREPTVIPGDQLDCYACVNPCYNCVQCVGCN